jgi:hypothetical protein
MALAMGLVSTAAVGAASSIAFKWRQRVQRRLQERKQGLEPGVETFVRYVAESPRLLSNGNVTGSKYVVKAIRSIKRTKFKKLNAVEVNIGDADDALVVGGNKYAVVPRHRHEVDEFRRQSLNSPEKSFQSPVIASPKTAIVDVKQLQGRVDRHDGAITKLHFESEESVPLNKKNRVSRYSVLLDASTEGKENEEEDRLKQVTNQGDSTKSLHNVTHDHVLDLIMHLTERQLNVLAVNDAHENVKKKNEALQATEKKQVEKNAQQDTFKDRRLMMALRHQEELDLMPETSFHRDRKKRWNTVKNKIIKKASAERARKDFMEELQHPDQPSSSIEWARILKAGREKMGKEMEERRRAFMLATSMSKDTNDTIRKIEDKRKKEAKNAEEFWQKSKKDAREAKRESCFAGNFIKQSRLTRQKTEQNIELKRKEIKKKFDEIKRKKIDESTTKKMGVHHDSHHKGENDRKRALHVEDTQKKLAAQLEENTRKRLLLVRNNSGFSNFEAETPETTTIQANHAAASMERQQKLNVLYANSQAEMETHKNVIEIERRRQKSVMKARLRLARENGSK